MPWLPTGAVYDKQYGWIVQVFNGPDSLGESFYYFTVTFKANAVTVATLPRLASTPPLTSIRLTPRGTASRGAR